MSKFLVDVADSGDGVRDFRAKQFLITLAQPEHRLFDGTFGDTQNGGDFRLRSRFFFVGEKRLQARELRGAAFGGVFLPQVLEHTVQECECPLLIVHLIGAAIPGRKEGCGGFATKVIKPDGRVTATAFRGGGVLPLVDEEILQRREQVRAKPAALLAHGLKVASCQDAGKESLHEIPSL
jgi:hypothetical protein